MSLSDLASLGSFVSGFAVCITLVFLVLQMRQANLNQRAMMQQMRAARTADQALKRAEPEISRSISRIENNAPDIEDLDIRVYMTMMAVSFMNWEDTFLQHQMGTLDSRSLLSDRAAMQAFAGRHSTRQAWALLRPMYDAGFRDYVDALIEGTELSTVSGLVAQWRTGMAARMSSS